MNYHAIGNGISTPASDMQQPQWRPKDLIGRVDVLKADINNLNAYYTSGTDLASSEGPHDTTDPYAAMRTRDNTDEYD